VLFYFHFHNGVLTPDEEGRSFPDRAAALRAAQQDALGLAAAYVRQGYLDFSHYVEVTDSSGNCLFKVTFRDVVDVIGFTPGT
jgi:hypothetical protein